MGNQMRSTERMAYVCPDIWTKFSEISEHVQKLYE